MSHLFKNEGRMSAKEKIKDMFKGVLGGAFLRESAPEKPASPAEQQALPTIGGDRLITFPWSIDFGYGPRMDILLRLDPAAEAAVAANPVSLNHTNALVRLLEMGAKQNNGVDEKGAVVPAERVYDEKTGKRIMIGYGENGIVQDVKPGEPARQYMHPENGVIYKAESFTAGISNGELTRAELLDLNARKGIAVTLPKSLQDFVVATTDAGKIMKFPVAYDNGYGPTQDIFLRISPEAEKSIALSRVYLGNSEDALAQLEKLGATRASVPSPKSATGYAPA
jgi:hypothetical protein